MSLEKPSFHEQAIESIVDQKIGVAKILARLDKILLDNSELDHQATDNIIDEMSDELKITPDQTELLKGGVAQYFEKHEAIASSITKFKESFGSAWQREFFKYCFGKYPEGNIDLREGPMTIYWLCESLDDYALACNEEPEEAKESFGKRKSLLDDQPEELRGTMILEYSGHPQHMASSMDQRSKKSKITETHEQQHVIFDMLKDELNYEPLNFDGLDANSSLAEVKVAVKRYLQFRRLEIERSAKNEIMAYWRDGERSIEEIKDLILEKGGSYDHRGEHNERELSKYLIARFGDNYKDFIPDLNIDGIWQQECAVFEYDILQALDVLKDIDKISPDKKNDYLYLLSLERSDKWRRTYELCKDKI